MVAGRRFYASPPGQQRVRRATDVLALAASLLGAAGLIAAQPPGPFEHALVRFLASVPDWLTPVWSFLVGIVVLWSLAMIVAPLVSRRPRITLEALLAMALAIVLGLLAARLATGDWPGFDTATGLSEHRGFPAVRLALAAAVIAVANAHLAHQARITGRWILALGAASAAVDGSTGVSGTAVAILIGLAAGAAMRLALGTSAGRPTIDEVPAALSDFGIDAGQLEPARRQSSGVFLAHGTDAVGERLDVKIYGRDAYDNQLLTKIWRTLWYRDSGASVGLTRAYPAEHEAFLTLLARDAGVPAVEVVMAGITAADDSLLVLRSGGQGIGGLDAASLDDDLLAAAWSAMKRLAEARIYHGRIDPWTVRVNDRSVLFADFAGGTLADDRDRSLIDQAQLLVTTATVAGIERAVVSAHTSLGGAGLAALLPYLQQAALGKSLRQAAKAAEIDVDALRAGAAEATGAEVPEPVRLRRVRWSVVIQIALLVFAAAAVLSFVSGVDLAELRDDVRDASWGWIIAAAVIAQLPRLTQAVSTQGAIPVDVPYGPLYMLQLATSYLNLALPSGLARMAVNVLLPDDRRQPSGRDHLGCDRLVRRQRRPGDPADPAAGVLGGHADAALQPAGRAGHPAPAVPPDRDRGDRAGARGPAHRPDGTRRHPRPRSGRGLAATGARRDQIAAPVAAAGSAAAGQRRHRGAVCDRAWHVRPRHGLPAVAGRAARDQHERLAVRQLHPRAGRHRHRRGRAGGRPDGSRATGVVGVRDRPAVPHRDVLPAAVLGLVRAAVAAPHRYL